MKSCLNCRNATIDPADPDVGVMNESIEDCKKELLDDHEGVWEGDHGFKRQYGKREFYEFAADNCPEYDPYPEED